MLHLGSRILEILRNILISHINGRLVHPSLCKKMRMGRIFLGHYAAFLFFLHCALGITRHYLHGVFFYDGSAAHSSESCHFSSCARVHRADNMKWTSLDFSFSFSKKPKNSSSRRVREQERGDVSGGGKNSRLKTGMVFQQSSTLFLLVC